MKQHNRGHWVWGRPCTNPALVRDEDTLPLGAAACAEMDGFEESQTNSTRGQGLGIHFGAMSTLVCGVPIHAEALSHLGGKAAQVSHPTSHWGQCQHQSGLHCPVGWCSSIIRPMGGDCSTYWSNLSHCFIILTAYIFSLSVPASGSFIQAIFQCHIHLNSSSLYPLQIHS